VAALMAWGGEPMERRLRRVRRHHRLGHDRLIVLVLLLR
jgi:hypothetical protein